MFHPFSLPEFFDGLVPAPDRVRIRVSFHSLLWGCLLLGSALSWLPTRRMNQPVVVVWDGGCGFCQRSVQRIARMDWLKRLRFVSSKEVDQVPAEWVEGWTPEIVKTSMWVKGMGSLKAYTGFEGFRRIAWAIPLGWLLLPLLYFPGVPWVGDRVYRWVARNRHRFGCHSDRCDLP